MRVRRWQLGISCALTFGMLVLAYLNHRRIWAAAALPREARPAWLLLALTLELGSFFCASQVYDRALRSLGYRFGALRLWATALVAIVLSQSVPAGGVASYAFLVQSFRRQRVSAGHAALVAALEALSYAGGMLLLFSFSLAYLALHAGGVAAVATNLVAATVALLALGGALFVLTRDQAVLSGWLLGIKHRAARIMRRTWSDTTPRAGFPAAARSSGGSQWAASSCSAAIW